MNDTEKQMLEKLEKRIMEIGVSNEFLVQIIELAGQYLNLRTISAYAKIHHMSYNGAKHNRKIVKIFDTNFVIDNA